MEWVASTLHTTSEHGVSSITTADVHTSAASSRLNWRPPADLNGLVRFAERRNPVSVRVPSHFKHSLICRYLCALTHQAYGSGNVNLNHSSNTGGCLGSSFFSKLSRFTEWESDKSVTDNSHICKVQSKQIV